MTCAHCREPIPPERVALGEKYGRPTEYCGRACKRAAARVREAERIVAALGIDRRTN